mmetsp:Transcript_60142/g.147851  ORF Transcript_60142/g.147851 Transcript_60142/m.147851 type:complete len:410 (+) Transcript_60142:1043-2272(+)
MLERLPRLGRDDLKHANQDAVEDGESQRLKGNGDGLLLHGDGRILGVPNGLDHLAHCLDLVSPRRQPVERVNVGAEGVVPPLEPPVGNLTHLTLKATDHRRAANDTSVRIDRVGDPVRHRHQALGPDGLVFEEAADRQPVAIVLFPSALKFVEAREPVFLHVGHELPEHLIGQDVAHVEVPVPGGVHKVLHVVHELGVLIRLVSNPVLERVVVDCGNVPRRHTKVHVAVRGVDARKASQVCASDLVHQHLVVVSVPSLPVELDAREERRQFRQECCNLLVVGPNDKVDETLLRSNSALRVAIAHGSDVHAIRALHVPLQEELVRDTHGPLLGHLERLEDIGRVGALDEDLHAELLVDLAPPHLAILGLDRGVCVCFQLGHVFPMTSHVSRKDDVHHKGPELVELLGREA